MGKEKSKLQLAQEQTEQFLQKTNQKIEEMGETTSILYERLNNIQQLFDLIRNMPNEKKLEYEGLKKIRLAWKQQAEKIEADYKHMVIKNAGKGAAGIGAGVAVAALGPAAAMGVATTFGVASTGTAISTLSGAAATNAALAWLGGGALAAGGGGMAAGHFLLALAGPLGWAIAGAALLGSGFMLWKGKKEQERLEDIFCDISKRDVNFYELAIVEINERIRRITDEIQKIGEGIEQIKSFGLDYNLMTESQQYQLGAYVNLMNSSTQLLVNPILGLQPKYTAADFGEYLVFHKQNNPDERIKQLIIALANLLYKINLDDKDKQLLWQTFRDNKPFMESLVLAKRQFDFSVMETVFDALDSKYSSLL